MKLKSSLIALALCFTFATSKAQNQQGESVVTAGIGYSLAIEFIKTSLNAFEDVTSTSIPAIGITFDHGLTDNFSMGIATGFQTLSAEFNDSYLDENNNTVTEKVTSTTTRFNVAARPLFHYGGSDKLDLYSGLRIGITSLNTSYETTRDDFEVGDLGGTRLSVGLVAFGMRYYFSDNVGMNFDLQLGAPYIISAGVAARF